MTMLGQAGTGKTLLALAVGLQLVAEEKRYRRIMVSRPIMPLGKDIGYLPGIKDEKLEQLDAADRRTTCSSWSTRSWSSAATRCSTCSTRAWSRSRRSPTSAVAACRSCSSSSTRRRT